MRDAQPLAHPQRVVADASFGLGRSQPDELDHLVHPAVGQTYRLRSDLQDLASRTSGVLRGRVEKNPDMKPRVRDPRVGMAVDEGGALVWRRETHEDSQRGCLSSPIGPEEARDGTGATDEGHIIDGSDLP